MCCLILIGNILIVCFHTYNHIHIFLVYDYIYMYIYIHKYHVNGISLIGSFGYYHIIFHAVLVDLLV